MFGVWCLFFGVGVFGIWRVGAFVFGVCWCLFDVWCSVFVVRSDLFVVCCCLMALFDSFVRRVLLVRCCVLLVVRCSLLMAG